MNPAETTRAFILGAVFDFVLRCARRDPPMVVGIGYPRDRLIEEFEAWAAERGLKLDFIAIDQFRKACELKALG
jgi:hypothetical protein